VLNKNSGFYENVIASRFFKRLGRSGERVSKFLVQMGHQRIYAEDILLLNEGAKGNNEGVDCEKKLRLLESTRQKILGDNYVLSELNLSTPIKSGEKDGNISECLGVHLLPVAPSETCDEISQLEMNQGTILRGMKDGARRVLQIFLPSMLAAQRNTCGGGVSLSNSQSSNRNSTAYHVESTSDSKSKQRQEQAQLIEDMLDSMFPSERILNNTFYKEDYEEVCLLQAGSS